MKGASSGVLECKIDFGPGYRVYFGKDGAGWRSSLAGDRKSVSRKTLPRPRNDWADYKQRKKQEME